jgi:inorganic triphosphatase YgiF
MPNETELKYAPAKDFSKDMLFSLPEISPFCGEVREIAMKTEYLDTKDSLAASRGVSLRRRVENGKSILYAKCNLCTSGELSVRGEWQVDGDDLSLAAELLESAGAPTDFLKGHPLEVCGRVSFVRHEAVVSLPEGLSFALSFDEGTFGENAPFSEVELELLSGEPDDLLRFGRDLAEKYSFTPESRSKYARSLIR